jgi:hypothetical protein
MREVEARKRILSGNVGSKEKTDDNPKQRARSEKARSPSRGKT